MKLLRPKFQRVINRVQAIRRHFHRHHQISEGGTYTGTGIETYADADAEIIEDQSIDVFPCSHSSYQSSRMNFIRTKLQRVINRVQAIRRYFRRPCPILEVAAEADAEVPEPFQLLDLPHVALRKIVLHVNPLALIDLSMTSDKLNEKMKEIKLSAEGFSWHFDKNGMFITCHFEESFVMLYCGPEDPPGPVVKRRIGGKVRLVSLYREDEPEDDRDDEPEWPQVARSRSHFSYQLKLSQRDRLEEEEVKITTQLLDIIKPKIYNLRIHSGINLKDLFVWKFSMNFDTIMLEEEYATYRFGPKEAQFLFQEVAVREIVIEFETRPEVWGKEQRAKLLETTRTMQLRNTIQRVTVINFDLLFSAENIINSEIKLLWMFSFCEDPDKPVFYKELAKIMKAWQEGEKLTQLEKIETSSKGVFDEELESLFEGIDWTSERPNHPQFESYAPTHGLVRDSFIRRKTDGQIASFSDYNDKFFFVVWKEGQLNLDLIYDQSWMY